jgi:lactoylglutathione lyase
MKAKKEPLFKNVDCIQVYVPNLEKGIDFYCNHLGLKIIWKTDSEVGLGMADNVTEIIIQNKENKQEIDIKVDSVVEAVERINKAGGRILFGPFDIKIGKCAVVTDLWDNKYIILDSTKGILITDNEGNIIGQKVEVSE